MFNNKKGEFRLAVSDFGCVFKQFFLQKKKQKQQNCDSLF